VVFSHFSLCLEFATLGWVREGKDRTWGNQLLFIAWVAPPSSL